MMVCNVSGKIGLNDYGTVGSISSEFPLDSMQFDIATLKFNNDYKGVSIDSNKQASVFTYIKSICGTDRDIACPICMISSPYDFDINVLASGWVSTIKPSGGNKLIHSHAVGAFVIMMVVPGKTKDTITEFVIRLPSTINITRKVIYLKDFNIYISGCNPDILLDIISEKSSPRRNEYQSDAVVSINIKANIPHKKRVSFCFNGIVGETIIDKTEDNLGTVTVRVGSTTVLTKTIPNKQFLTFESQIMCSWDDFGGVNLLIDDNYDRLIRGWNRISDLKGCVGQDSFDKINNLVTENKALQQEIEEINLRMKQEEHKTYREEIKTQGAIFDQRHAAVMEAIKLGGGIVGFISIIITLVSKMNSSTDKKKLIEWSIPIIKKGMIDNKHSKEIVVGLVAMAAFVGSGVLLYRKLSAL